MIKKQASEATSWLVKVASSTFPKSELAKMIDGIGFGIRLAVEVDDRFPNLEWLIYVVWMAVEGYVEAM